MAIETGALAVVQRSAARAEFDFGWLTTRHSFSFADYYDPENINWGALRVFNDDIVQPGEGFGTHPHRDMEIITCVLDGELEHRDSMGNHGVVHAGGVQYMSAGTGVLHSEFNGSTERPVHFVQMWVLPARAGEEPQYGQLDFGPEDRDGKWLTIAAPSGAPIALRQDAMFRVARARGGKPLLHTFARGRYGFTFVGSGSVAINGETCNAGDALRTYDVPEVRIEGDGEIVLWDVASTDIRLEDA
jgi:quercetin 2,3-dioxygenase